MKIAHIASYEPTRLTGKLSLPK